MTLEELKAEFNRLSPDDQIEFARWAVWEEYEETEKQRKLSWLRHEAQKGIDSGEDGKKSRPGSEVFAELLAGLKNRSKQARKRVRSAVSTAA